MSTSNCNGVSKTATTTTSLKSDKMNGQVAAAATNGTTSTSPTKTIHLNGAGTTNGVHHHHHHHQNGFAKTTTSNGEKASEESAGMSYEEVKESADYLLQGTHYRPKIAIICGTGLGPLSELVEDAVSFPYSEIPNFPECTAPGHSSRMLFGKLNGVQVMLMQGRFHLYEGYDIAKCAMPVRVMKLVGVERMVVTAAAGGLNPNFKVGDVMMLDDHVNFPGFAGINPLRGPNDERFGPRFLGLEDCYDPELRQLASEAAAEMDMELQEGCYVALGGPTFETPAELRLMKAAGIDAVGMSIVHEAITARHCGMDVLAFSIISNMCVLKVKQKGLKQTPEEKAALTNEVIQAVNSQETQLKLFFSKVVGKLDSIK